MAQDYFSLLYTKTTSSSSELNMFCTDSNSTSLYKTNFIWSLYVSDLWTSGINFDTKPKISSFTVVQCEKLQKQHVYTCNYTLLALYFRMDYLKNSFAINFIIYGYTSKGCSETNLMITFLKIRHFEINYLNRK